MRGAVLYGQRDVRFEERAVPTMAMTHIAIQEQLDGKTVDWMEQESSLRTVPQVRLLRARLLRKLEPLETTSEGLKSR